MNKNTYEQPELTKYGNIDKITQASGVGGSDILILGIDVNNSGNTNTVTGIPSVGSSNRVSPSVTVTTPDN